jgi:TPR repeat protein
MKKIIFLFICLFAFSVTNMAQKEAIRRQAVGTVPVDKARGQNGKQSSSVTRHINVRPRSTSNKSAASYVRLGLKCYENDSYYQAFANFKKAANMGDDDGMYLIGYCYYYGRGTAENNYEAIRWFKLSTKNGNPSAMLYLGDCYHYGYGTEQDLTSALYWYKQAVDKGNNDAYAKAGGMYENGEGVSQDYAEAYNWYQKGANVNDGACMCALGRFYFYGYGNVTQNMSTAMSWWQKSSDTGNGDAMWWIAWAYLNGYGVTANSYTAFNWFKKGADAGDPESLRWMGYCYQNGIGTTENHYSAIDWYKKAMNAGNTDAINDLAYCYFSGIGVSEDKMKAVEYYQKGVDAGNANSMSDLGYCYSQGFGVYKDAAKAVKYYTQAANLGNGDAMNELGNCYLNGFGVSEDDKEAYNWFYKAVQVDNVKAYGNIGLLCLLAKGTDFNPVGGQIGLLTAAGRGDVNSMYYLGKCFKDGTGLTKNTYFAKLWLQKAIDAGYTDAKSELDPISSFVPESGKYVWNPAHKTVQSNEAKVVVSYVQYSEDFTKVGLDINNTASEGQWFFIQPTTYISTPDGNKYFLVYANNIGITRQSTFTLTVDANSKKSFSLLFPPIPKKTEKINLIEDDKSSDWKFYDIELK